MVFGGIQKLTLLDYPEKTACTLFTIGCDFNCPFCQNSALIDPNGAQALQIEKTLITSSEVLEFLETRRGLLDGVCISGGEPLLHNELESFIDAVKSMDYLIKIDTNGSDPVKLKKLISSQKIDFVSMDIKNTPEKYAQTIGLSKYDITKIEESINLLITSMIPYEFRTTVVREFHTGDDLLSIARWILSLSDLDIKYFLQKFIDSEGVKQKGLHCYSDAEMKQFLSDFTKILPFAETRGV